MKRALYPTSLRFTLEGRWLLLKLAAKMGITMAAVIEIALRLLAEREFPAVELSPEEISALPADWKERMLIESIRLALAERDRLETT